MIGCNAGEQQLIYANPEVPPTPPSDYKANSIMIVRYFTIKLIVLSFLTNFVNRFYVYLDYWLRFFLS